MKPRIVIFLLLLKLLEVSNDHYNEDYNDDIFLLDDHPREAKIVDDLPLQDARLLRDSKQEVTNIQANANFANNSQRITPEFAKNANASKNMPVVDPHMNGTSSSTSDGQEWIEEAIKDIAYYLRAHKFNEYDRRYEANGTLAPRTYHRENPRPPLRSLHWEVHKFCDESFLACIKYLWKRAQGADLRRVDDTAVVIQEQRWRMVDDRQRIDMVEGECQKLKRRDDILADPFQGPLERFQWRTTASYFMCWLYAMNEVGYLRHFGENCDNFANCLDPKFGARNHDPRANDDSPFACALYSFCPDPCCHEKHVENLNSCWSTPQSNPCHSASAPGRQECTLNRSQNLDFTSGILNHWNVSCSCPHLGYVWDSSYGICVDVDECLQLSPAGTAQEHKCDVHRGEACLNTVGGFKCVCKWGHTWSNELGSCQKNEAISQIKLIALKMLAKKIDEEEFERSYLRRGYKYFKKLLFSKKTTERNTTNLDHNSDISQCSRLNLNLICVYCIVINQFL